MISLLQQTAATAVQTTPTTPDGGYVTTYTVPLNAPGAVAPAAPADVIPTAPAAPIPPPVTALPVDVAPVVAAPAPIPAPPVPVTPAPVTPAPVPVNPAPVTAAPVPADPVSVPVAPAPAADVNPHGTDAIQIPGTGDAAAPSLPVTGMGHAPADTVAVPHAVVPVTPDAVAAPGAGAVTVPDATHAVVAADGTHAVVAQGVVAADPHVVAAAHEAAQSAGMPQLDFSTFGNQIFWLLVALALIYLILSRLALPRIGRILGDRQGLMTADLSAAEDFKRKARDAETAYDKALADARAEAGKIVAANRAGIDAELKTAIDRADAEIAARGVESERRIREIRDSAAQDARGVALDVTRALVGRFGVSADEAALSAAVDARMNGAVQ